jgi:hypothetical protein
MIRCPGCGIFNPPQTFEHQVCLDHAKHVGWGRSPSAAAIAQIQYFNLRVEACELEPESHESLQREIESGGKGASGI